MGLKKCLLSSAGATVLGAGINAGLNAAAGAAGAAILSASGYSDYNVKEAAEIGAIGGSILGAVGGIVSGSLASCGFFNRKKQEEKSSCGVAIGYTGQAVLSGLIGYGILNSANVSTVMSLSKTAAALAVGGAVTMIPSSCALMCIGVPLALGIMACTQQEEKEENVAEENNIVVNRV